MLLRIVFVSFRLFSISFKQAASNRWYLRSAERLKKEEERERRIYNIEINETKKKNENATDLRIRDEILPFNFRIGDSRNIRLRDGIFGRL